MKDLQTHDEFSAAIAEQMRAYPATDDRDHDEPGPTPEPAHDPATCPDDQCRELLCVLHRVVVAQQQDEREERKAWAEYKASQRDEEAS